MNPKFRSFLIVSAKQAVGAVVGNTALMAMLPATFNFHDHVAMLNILKATLGFVLAAEAKVWVPKIVIWVNSPTLSIVLLACLMSLSCASMNYKAHPGSYSTFDSKSYDTLYVTHNLIEATKADLAAGKFGALAPSVTKALNDLIAAYDIADSTYLAYHASAATGSATPAQQATLTNALANVNATTTSLTNSKGGK